jgi:hypothetical protein
LEIADDAVSQPSVPGHETSAVQRHEVIAPAVHRGAKLVLGAIVLTELAWLSLLGYFLYRLAA